MRNTVPFPRTGNEARLRRLWRQVFEDPEDFLDLFFGLPGCLDRCCTASRDGKVVSALYWFDCDFRGRKLAYLYGAATDPAYRGQGIFRELMEDYHAVLTERGYAGSLLVPAEGLAGMYEKMGYRYVCCRKVWTAQAGESSAALTEVSAEEFGRLRAEYLPENAVSQTGTNLTFLAGQAKLFRGADFLLAAETRPFRGIELLGNTEAAPGILRALDEKEGVFSTIGSETPFAMYHALQPGPEPTYFGLAFD